MSTDTELARTVNRVVSSYARRCWWADPDDLRQEAWVAAIEARAKWDPTRGPIGPYATTAVRRAISAYLLHETSPVSSSWHDRHNLIGLSRADVSGSLEPGRGEASEAAVVRHNLEQAVGCQERTWADDLLEDARWRVRVLARLMELVESESTLDELIGEIQRIGRPPEWFKHQVKNLRERLAGDVELREIWEERDP